MSTLTVYGIAGDGWVRSSNAAYATARSGSSIVAFTPDGNNLAIGQDLDGNYYCYESFIGFDTSALGSGATVSAATLSLWLLIDSSTVDWTVQARLQSWSSGGLTTADWVAGASLTQTLLATLATSGIGATGAYKDFTSDAAFPGNINKTGNTEMILCASDMVAGTTPAEVRDVFFDDADTAGTTQDPKLVVTYSAPATVTLDIASDAALSTTATKDIASDAALNAPATKDIASAAALSAPATKDVASDAATTAPATKDVTTAAATTATVTLDLATAAVVTTTNTKDVAEAAAIQTTNTKDVAAAGVVTTTGTKDIASDAVITAGTTVTLDLAEAAAVSVGLTSDGTPTLYTYVYRSTGQVGNDVAQAAALSVAATKDLLMDASVGIFRVDVATAGVISMTATADLAFAGCISVGVTKAPGSGTATFSRLPASGTATATRLTGGRASDTRPRGGGSANLGP